MIISNVFYNFFIEMCVLILIAGYWAKHQDIIFFKLDVFLFKSLRLKILIFKNNAFLNLNKFSINSNLK